jgi:hypothetical protein
MVCEAYDIVGPVNETTVCESRISTTWTINGYETHVDISAELVPTSSDKTAAWETMEKEDGRMRRVRRAIGGIAKSAPVR